MAISRLIKRCLFVLPMLLLFQGCANSAVSSQPDAEDPALDPDVIVVADFRKSNSLSSLEVLEEQSAKASSVEIVDLALGAGASNTFFLADSVIGSFTTAGSNQSLHMLVNKEFSSTASQVTPPILVVFENEQPVTQFVLSDASYTRIETLIDIDDDGYDEVLLTAPMIHMGKVLIGADLYGFANPQELNRQKLGLVYESGCEMEAPSGGQITAGLITKKTDDSTLQIEWFTSPCE